MMRDLLRNTVAVAGFTALLLVGACASKDGLDDQTETTIVEPGRQAVAVETTPMPPIVESKTVIVDTAETPVVTEATITETTVEPGRQTIAVQTTPMPPIVEPKTVIVDTTETPAATKTNLEPMTSSVQETTTTTTTEDEPARTRLRKD